ncbi:hypothetical protein B0T22DRAFT_295024 [Podospora appendiculata]|uniref:Uncharacterized protein n=1 Tax=Podospora appendiculata TaxID=314037 RepID=A0AAE1C8F7_9PEZI|nr:hypothetical protein B0T22DRAFT_295024 [Podospora appendiculata]
MLDLDAATISAIAALVVAGIALVVALAQALQQYFITGQLIRLCDSVVFGPLPGQGHRIWQPTQFRFRVIYSLPQINLQADLWPGGVGSITKSYSIGKDPLPPLANARTTGQDALVAASYNSPRRSDSVISYKKSFRWLNPVSWVRSRRTRQDDSSDASTFTRTSTRSSAMMSPRSSVSSLHVGQDAIPSDNLKPKFDFRRV